MRRCQPSCALAAALRHCTIAARCFAPVPAPRLRTSRVLVSASAADSALWTCKECGRTFGSAGALQQHSAAKHAKTEQGGGGSSLCAEDLDAPVDEPGRWVPREEFSGRKSFGAFKCGACQKRWISAHAFPDYQQGCKACEEESLPVLMWVNAIMGKRDKTVMDLDREKPHDSARCQACRAGVCTVFYTRDYYY